jgi:hypothetical protein
MTTISYWSIQVEKRYGGQRDTKTFFDETMLLTKISIGIMPFYVKEMLTLIFGVHYG